MSTPTSLSSSAGAGLRSTAVGLRSSRFARRLEAIPPRRLYVVIVVITLLAILPGLTVGFAADDYLHRVRLHRGIDFPGFPSTQLDLFAFATGEPEQRRALMEAGVFSWWTPEGYTLSFFRPLTSLTHVLDYALWPDRPEWMMVHNFGWYLGTVAMAGLLFRRVFSPATALLALWIFALDDAHGPTVGYIANRNALVAGFFGVTCLWAHDLWRRDGASWAGVFAPVALAASLLAGEAGVATLGYLVGYAAAYDDTSLRERWRALVPCGIVALGWGVARHGLGYGTFGSGMYIDPLVAPLDFASAALERIPILLTAQFGLPWSDVWLAYPPWVAALVLGFAITFLGVLGWALMPVVRRDRGLRWMAIGCIASAVPIASTFPADRLLLLVGLGASPLIAAGIMQLVRRSTVPGHDGGSRLQTVLFGFFAVWHGLLSPWLLPVRVQSMQTVERMLAKLDDSVGDATSLVDKTVIVLDAPNDGLTAYLAPLRASRDEPRPHGIRLLTTGEHRKKVTTLDAHTLRIQVPEGFLTAKTETMLRGPEIGFEPGDRVRLSDLEVMIVDVTSSGRPRTIDVRFERPLRDPSYVWRRWQDTTFVPVVPPAEGEHLELDAPDPTALMLDVLRSPEP